MNIQKLIESTLNDFLKEDVKLAEKLLKDKGISLENEEYLKTKEYLSKNNSLGYLGYIVKMKLNNTNDSLFDIAEFIIKNRNLIKQLNHPISYYNNFDNLIKDINKIEINKNLKKITNKLTNKYLTELLLNDLNAAKHNIEDINYFLKIPSSNQKEFLSYTDKFHDTHSFYVDMKEFNKLHKEGFNYSKVLNLIQGMSQDEIKLLYDKNNKILARILKYSAASKIGRKSWCIVGEEEYFDEYTKDGENMQYFLFNFNEDVEPNQKMMAFTLDKNNNVTYAFDRNNQPFNDVKNYLKKIGIIEKVYELNSRELFNKKINDINLTDTSGLTYIITKRKNIKRNNKPRVEVRKDGSFNKRLKNISTMFLNLLSSKDVKQKNHLDIIIKKMQSFPTVVIIFDYYTNSNERNRPYKPFNILSYILDNFDDVNNNTIPKDDFIKIIKKIYLSNIKLNKDTTLDVMKFLKNNNVDILKLSNQKKSTNNKNLTDVEFNMLSKQQDMKPIIQNKLSAIRRGENVDISNAEIIYAIDNGYKNIIDKYYMNMINKFNEQPLSYDELKIYQKLNKLKNISNVIISKANNYGVNSLNSIEKSLYDMTNK